jgi:hypothetical protein
VRTEFNYAEPGTLTPPLEIEGLVRRVAFLSHPAARARGRYPRKPDRASLAEMHGWLEEAARGRKYSWGPGDLKVIRSPTGS